MQEIWKDIKGFENRYQISNLGRVKSLKRKVKKGKNSFRTIEERILRPRIDKKYGYQIISLRIHPQKYFLSIHRLVAETFIPNPNNYPCVNHKDNNPSNNCVNNLEWCTQSYNVQYAYKHGNAKPTAGCFKKGNIPHNRRKINQYSKDDEFLKTFKSIRAAAKSVNTVESNIGQCLSGKTKTAKGYIWRYADK